MGYTKEEIQEYIDSLDFTELTNRDYVDEALTKDLSTEKYNELKNFFYKTQEFFRRLCDEIVDAMNKSVVIQTFKKELIILWNKVSPEIKNILIGGAHIVKYVYCFVISSKQYIANLIYDINRDFVIVVSDLFCCVINGVFKPIEA